MVRHAGKTGAGPRTPQACAHTLDQSHRLYGPVDWTSAESGQNRVGKRLDDPRDLLRCTRVREMPLTAQEHNQAGSGQDRGERL
jgi:hypothetical protein